MKNQNDHSLPKLTFREKYIFPFFCIGMLLPVCIGFFIEDKDIRFVLGSITMSTLLLTLIFRKDMESGAEKMRDIRASRKKIEFTTNTIYFRYPYEFKHSSIRHKSFLRKEDISEIGLNTFPLSLIVNQNEVIFIPTVFKAKLKYFAEQHRIPLSRRFDIWAAINEVFLDTEVGAQRKQALLADLAKEGVSNKEVSQIREKIEGGMIRSVFYTYEWIYLGHYDTLCAPLWKRKKFYWWTMEIALRNYKGDA